MVAPLDARIIRLTGPIFSPNAYELKVFAAAGLTLQLVDAVDPREIADQVREADIVTVIGTPIPATVIDAMIKCRAIARLGTGTDKIDVARATELGIVVANTPYFCIEEMADHVMAMLLSLARQLTVAQNAMAEGDVMRARRAVGSNQRVSACTLGLVGFGRSAVH